MLLLCIACSTKKTVTEQHSYLRKEQGALIMNETISILQRILPELIENDDRSADDPGNTQKQNTAAKEKEITIIRHANIKNNSQVEVQNQGKKETIKEHDEQIPYKWLLGLLIISIFLCVLVVIFRKLIVRI